MGVLKGLLVVFAAVLGAGMTLLNSELVHLNYYLGIITLPLSLLLAATLVAGVLLGGVASLGTLIAVWRRCARFRLEARRTEPRSPSADALSPPGI